MADDPVPVPNGNKYRMGFNFLRSLIAISTLLGSFGIFALVSMGKCDIQWKDVVMIIVGAVIANCTSIVNWYFGSSEDSSKKTELLTAK